MRVSNGYLVDMVLGERSVGLIKCLEMEFPYSTSKKLNLCIIAGHLGE